MLRRAFMASICATFKRPLARGAAAFLRNRAGALVRQARGALGDGQPAVALRLGIPPAQYEALAGGRAMGTVLRSRVERLACGFSLDDNYFAWQAFGRRYGGDGEGPLPPYLRREHFAAVRARVDRVEVLNRSITEHLATCPDARATATCCSTPRTG